MYGWSYPGCKIGGPQSNEKDAPRSPPVRRRSSAEAHTPDHPPKHTCARITNHQQLLPDLDGRSSAGRRFRDLVGAFVADMGGLDQCSEVKLGLLRQLAAVTVKAELLAAQMFNGEPINVFELCALASTTVRLSSRLGLERVPKPFPL
jgi:hypothetical protein